MSEAFACDASLFPGALASFRNTLFWDDQHSTPVLDRPALLEVLVRFQRSVDGAWRPACSFWAQLYFNTLLVPAICLLANGGGRPFRVATVAAKICPASGKPLSCALQAIDPDPLQSGESLAHWLASHISAVIVDLNAVSRLSKALLQESVERTLNWTLDEIELFYPARTKVAAVLLKESFPSVRRLSDNVPSKVRRLCCLRDQLPHISPCEDTCPRHASNIARVMAVTPASRKLIHDTVKER